MDGIVEILIAPLGSGGYEEKGVGMREYRTAKYKFPDSGKIYETSFITAAISEHLKVDKIILVGTKNSMWEEVYRYFGKIEGDLEKEKKYFSLIEKIGDQLTEVDLQCVNEVMDEFLKNINPHASGGSVCKILEYGMNDEELFKNLDIFMDLQQQFQPADKIYLDITHSFRSIPLFMYLMIDFIQTLRKDIIRLSGIYYGMFEVSRELDYTPIIDLNPLFSITKWTKGVFDFVTYGNVDLMAELMEDNDIKQTMLNISKLTNLNYIRELRSQMDKLRYQLEKVDDVPVPQSMLLYLKPELLDFVNYFKGVNNDAEFQFRLAKWFFDHNRYANGYICLAESIITYLQYIYKKRIPSIDYQNKNDRKKIQDLLLHFLKNDSNKDYQKIGQVYDEIRIIRNHIAHAGFGDHDDYDKVIKKSLELANTVEKYIFHNSNETKLSKLPSLYDFNNLRKRPNFQKESSR